MPKRKQILSIDEGKPATKQHKSPCSDCPFARKAVSGWLGGLTPEQSALQAAGEVKIDCHVHLGVQCAGAAIYRSNTCKSPRDKSLLILPRDTTKVFKNHIEFIAHHSGNFPAPVAAAAPVEAKKEKRGSDGSTYARGKAKPENKPSRIFICTRCVKDGDVDLGKFHSDKDCARCHLPITSGHIVQIMSENMRVRLEKEKAHDGAQG